MLFTDLDRFLGGRVILDRLGDVAFHAFLVAAYRGTVYRYVGDVIIVTWPAELDDAAERTVRCALAMRRLLAARRDEVPGALRCCARTTFCLARRHRGRR
ncbi:hypothetical protein [Ferruginivarius sediminum]|uniref:hypothetical protein n=1 Tax=Ferruginivarius sediminum TaxID=2661937 RepID=UPI00137A8029|nr:hypothetical protein [Ferruginivarius sediminum]